MSIQEEITALLNGELADEARVAELMHVLAVSPEKRTLLVEQIRMSRGYSALGSSIVPSDAADQRIWEGIAAVDAGLAPIAPLAVAGAATAPAAVGLPFIGKVGLLSLLSLLLVGLGLGTGYMLGFDYAVDPPEFASARPESDPTFLLLAAAQDSLDHTRQQLQDLGAGYDKALEQIGQLRGLDSSRRSELARSASRIRTLERDLSQASRRVVVEPRAVVDQTPLSPVPPGEISLKLIGPTPGEPLPEHHIPKTIPVEEPVEKEPRFQVEARQMFRFSLPRVYGLSTSPSVFRDKELIGSIRLGEGKSLLSTVRGGMAVGETQFGQIFHTNRDTIGIDKTIRQSPSLLYGRAYIAPRLVTFGDFSTSLEMGGGATVIGPIGTAGLTLEYAPGNFPLSLSVIGGVSGWMLWSGLDGETFTSTNLNGSLGIAIAF